MKTSRPLAGLLLVMALAAPAGSDSLPYVASFTIELGTFNPVVVGPVSGMLEANVTGGSHIVDFTLPAGAFAAQVSNPVSPPIPLVGPPVALTKVAITASNGAGAFIGSFPSQGGPPKGLMPVLGQALLYIGGNPVTLNINGAIGTTNTVTAKLLNIIPLKLVAQGFTTHTAVALSAPLGNTALTAPIPVTRMGSQSTTILPISSYLGDLSGLHGRSFIGYVKRTTLSYVAPTQINITGLATISAFGTLGIIIDHLVPEPGTVWLVASSVAGVLLVGLGLRRRRG